MRRYLCPLPQAHGNAVAHAQPGGPRPDIVAHAPKIDHGLKPSAFRQLGRSQISQVHRHDVISIWYCARARHERDRLDCACDLDRGAGWRRKETRRRWLSEFQIQQFPIAKREFARGEFPEHEFLSREPIAAARQLVRQHLARGEGAVAVAQDAIEWPPAERSAQVFGETGRFSPTQRLKGKDIRKTVAEQQDVRVALRPPRCVADRDLSNRHRFRRINGIDSGQLQHSGDVSRSVDLLFRNLRPARRGLPQTEGYCELPRHQFHRLRPPVRICLQIKRALRVCCFTLHEPRRGIEDAHAGRAEPVLEFVERRVLQRLGVPRWRAQSLAFDRRLCRHWHQDQFNATRGELIAELQDRW